MSRVVVSDTSPLRYLVIIGLAELLPALYGEVYIPKSVGHELAPGTPQLVRAWMAMPALWLSVVSVTATATEAGLVELDAGERDAIALAREVKADLPLMDDREGVEAARGLGLPVTGTLDVLDLAARRDLIELAPAIEKLRETNFRVNPILLSRLIEADSQRRSKWYLPKPRE
jgi:predicted nucleic acid-binding protein